MATTGETDKAKETPIRRSLRNVSRAKYKNLTPHKESDSKTTRTSQDVEPLGQNMEKHKLLGVKMGKVASKSKSKSTASANLAKGFNSPKSPHLGQVESHDSLEKEGMDVTEEDFPANSSMSLDVLARVATETLENDTKFKQQLKAPKRDSRRPPQATDKMTLKQIRLLPDKSLVSHFSEFTSNEISRNFTFACRLMPQTCKEKFTSFGSETRARNQMQLHLVQHVEKLVDDAAKDGDEANEFTAESVNASRRKRAMDSAFKKNRRTMQIMKPRNVEYTIIKPRHDTRHDTAKRVARNRFLNLSLKSHRFSPKKPAARAQPDTTAVKNFTTEINDDYEGSKDASSIMSTIPGDEVVITQVKLEEGEEEGIPLTMFQEEAERRIEENEQFIIDLLSRSQPHHDHGYTTIFGKKRGIDADVHIDDDDDDMATAMVDRMVDVDPGETVPAVPMLLFSCDLVPPPDIGPVASQEVIIQDEVIMPVSVVSTQSSWTNDAPYPPMPKVCVTKRGRPLLAEKEERVSRVVAPHKSKKNVALGSSEWERRMALRCINELRGKKRDDKEPLACKICSDRIFTAAATLTYHYRSHAGIKPFVCLICNTTFTRQHSLNYHMLIHNNQSRFTCKDCGRRFRHPSHFKEHLRRHTGETPFECLDCRQKFKTRNTYKRHLKTRHGKVLKADGMHFLTEDEFLKVRTVPKRNLSDSIIFLESGAVQVEGEVGSEEEVELEDQMFTGQMDSPVRLQQLFGEGGSGEESKTILVPIINL